MATRRNRRTRARKARTMEALLALSRTALEATAQGVCVYDADNRVALFNRRYLDLFNLSTDVIRPGVTYRDVLEHSASRGNFAPERVEPMIRERLARLKAGAPISVRQDMPNGTIMMLELRPLPDGGWITVCDDITRRTGLETALQIQTERIEHAVHHMSQGLTMFSADERLIAATSNI
jgi:PAS domain-containing protein